MLHRTMLLVPILLFCCLNGCENSSQPCDPGDCDGCGPEDCGPVVRIIAITADWCPQCQKDKPTLNASGFNVTYKDFDVHEEEARELGIETLPTYIVYVDDGGLEYPGGIYYTHLVHDAISYAHSRERSL